MFNTINKYKKFKRNKGISAIKTKETQILVRRKICNEKSSDNDTLSNTFWQQNQNDTNLS